MQFQRRFGGANKIGASLPSYTPLLVFVLLSAGYIVFLVRHVQSNKTATQEQPVVITNEIRTKNDVVHTNVQDLLKEYPVYDNLLNVIKKWNPDNPDKPADFKELIHSFNYSDPKERKIAELYRNAEVPFKIYDVPEVDRIRVKWTNGYLKDKLDRSSNTHVEKSNNNHFMFWSMHNWRSYPNFKPPTEVVKMSFEKWLQFAEEADRNKMSNESSRYYFMSNAATGDRGKTFIAKDLDFFATNTENFFITNVEANKGIQCRFSTRGIIAESHYDTGKNMVAMFRGAKRYILTPPNTCSQIGIISDTAHPSYRHSVIDWSDVGQATAAGFDKVPTIDTVVEEGEVLYIPSFWFHYIISLKLSVQCNSRSGTPFGDQGLVDIEKCFGTKLRLGRYKSRKPSN